MTRPKSPINGNGTVRARRTGQTLLKGHSLIREGDNVFDENGVDRYSWQAKYLRVEGRSKCTCGQVSPPGTRTAGRKWHAEHKDQIRQQQASAEAGKQLILMSVDQASEAIRAALPDVITTEPESGETLESIYDEAAVRLTEALLKAQEKSDA